MAKLKRKPFFGLALGGGGARGLAHIGIMKVLLSEGFKPDLLSGTSMGAIIAIMTATGFSPQEMEREAEKTTRLGNILKIVGDDLSNLEYAFGNEGIQNFFRDSICGDKHFADLEIPTAIAAVDFFSASEVTLFTGSLVEAVNASIALPGVIQPVERAGMRLVDGGSLNNVPADLVRSMGAEVVIAVDVSPDVTDEDFWKEQKLPTIAAANWRNNAIMNAYITRAKLAKAKTDLVIRPVLPAQITTLTGFKNITEIIEAGQSAAEEALPEIRELLKPRIALQRPKIKKPAAMEL